MNGFRSGWKTCFGNGIITRHRRCNRAQFSAGRRAGFAGRGGPDQRLYRKDGLDEHLQAVKPVTYSVVKTGIIGLTRYLATYWAQQNVRCNALCPGGIENGQDSDFLTEVTARIPMARMAEVDEYQGVLVFMLSQASAYLSGAVIPVDGGRTAW